ncbi:MAG: hypothetical protein KZQ57_09840 [gamma proteobacterium symbiont of Lucinoma myriamae]|nr:hypothetical protein [gamma proteobacterium symbiont of Lucinoma myriamae]
MKIKNLLFSVAMTLSPLTVSASGIPTVDIANILQTTTSALENVQQTAHMATQKLLTRYSKLPN